MKYSIEPLYVPAWSKEEGYLPNDELVGYELWDEYGKVVAVAETREELFPYLFEIEEPPTVSPVPIR